MRRFSAATVLRVALGVAGLALLGAIVEHTGPAAIAETLAPALPSLPVLFGIEVFRIACEAAASHFAFGPLAPRIPRLVLFRAHLVGQSLGALAPAPRVVNETIKATLLAPFVGGAAAAAVGFVNQAATLIATGLFSIPCSVAILAQGGASVWFWAAVVHAVVLVVSGLALRAITRAGATGRWLAARLPRLGARAAAFHEHAQVSPWAGRPSAAIFASRAFQALQYGIAARAVGIDATFVRAMAAQGINLVSSAVGVLVPGGVGATDGAFTLAAGMLGTTVARAASLALLMRCNQLAWLLVGSVVALSARRAAASRAESA